MKTKIMRVLGLLLAIVVMANQMMLPVFAVAGSSVNCECGPTRNGVKVDEEAPTCTTYGVDVYVCNSCGKQYAEFTHLPLGHTEVDDPAVAPTCEGTGLTAGKHCSVCNEVTVPQTVVPETGHTEVDNPVYPAVAPDCVNTGLTQGTKCDVCGVVIKAQEVVKENGHTEGAPVEENRVEPYCDSHGVYDGSYQMVTYCTVCNVELSRKDFVIANEGHKYGPAVMVEGNCTEGGKIVHTCTAPGCGYQIEEIVSEPLKHIEVVDKAVAPTCEDTGLTEGKHCERCHMVLVAQTVVPANGHTSVPVPAVEETCSKTGLTAGEKCSVCDKVLVAQTVIPVNPAKHTPEVTVAFKAPTCSAVGNTAEVVCAECKEVLTEKTEIAIDPTAHSYKAVGPVAPTCTETGLEAGEVCEYCGDVKSGRAVVPANGHTDKAIPAVAPTCTEPGMTAGVECSVCGVVTTQPVVVPAMQHEQRISKGIVDPTCTAKGYEIFQCTTVGGCGETFYDNYTDKLPHPAAAAVEENKVDSTCTAEGSYDLVVYCSVCDEELSRETKTIAKKDHTPGAAKKENEVAATCTAEGSYEMATYCTVCKTEIARVKTVVDMKAHTPGTAKVENRKEATVDAKGSYEEATYCTVCKKELSRVTKEIAIVNENVSVSFKASGIAGSTVAVNSGKITVDVVMNVESYVARMWGLNLSLKFDTSVSLESVTCGDAFAAAEYTKLDDANTNYVVKLTQDMVAQADKSFEKGEYVIATLVFNVDDDFTGEVNFTADACKATRAGKSYVNTQTVNFAAGTKINVIKLGDANTDGKLDVEDTLAICEFLAAGTGYEAKFDMDLNGQIDGADFDLLRKAVVA